MFNLSMKKGWPFLLGMSVVGGAAMFSRLPWEWHSGPLWEPKAAYCRFFDTKHVVTLKGIVQRVEQGEPLKGLGYGLHLIVKTDTETLPVHLGPVWFVERQGVTFEPQDVVEITGSRVYCDGKPIILDSTIQKGGDLVRYRELNGMPLWAGYRH